MSTIHVDKEDKSYQKQCTILRLIILLLSLCIFLNNRQDQTNNLLDSIPELNEPSNLDRFKDLMHAFGAANTLGLVFVVMELIVLYVGTNRYRIKPTIFSVFMHVLGCYFYWHHSQWQYENMWTIFHVFSFLPLIAQIGVALYTAES